MKLTEKRDRVPNSVAKKHDGSRCDCDADERVERHRGWQTERLTQHLILLRFRITSEIGNVERNGRPKANHAGNGRNEEFQELAVCLKFAWCAEDWSEPAGLGCNPPKQQQSKTEHEGCANSFKKLDGVNAAPYHCNVQKPESEKTNPLAKGIAGCGRNYNLQHRKDCLSANPRLNAEPTTGN